MSAVESKFDKDGKLKKIMQIVSKMRSPSLRDEQQLIQVEADSKHVIEADIILFAASCAFFLAAAVRAATFGKFNKPEIKDRVADFLSFAAAMLFCYAFTTCLNDHLDAVEGGDIRIMGPVALKLLAAAVMTLKPMLSLMSLNHASPGLVWSDFVGIVLLNIGSAIHLFFLFLNDYNFSLTGDSYYRHHHRLLTILLFALGSAFVMSSNPFAQKLMGVKEENKTPETESKEPAKGFAAVKKGLGKVASAVAPLIGHIFLILGSSLFFFKKE